MFEFMPKVLKTDVIYVKLVDTYILAAIGNFLYIYELHTLKFLDRVQIFDGTKICGFVANKYNSELLIHGETKLKIICFNVLNKEYADISECKNNLEWILAATWIEDNNKVITVCMNNAATLWNLKFERLLTIRCKEKCIAYCAAIVNLNDKWEDLIILTGTVFSDLLIWRATQVEDKLCSVRRIKGHKGALFSISYNKHNNLLCTTSDDRSTIVWKINSDNLLNAFVTNETIVQKTILYGHTSRIFNCQVTENFILSAGEDGIVNVWNLDGTLFRKIDSHQGVNVWSVYCSEEENIIISGGSDCSVNISTLRMNIVAKSLGSGKRDFESIKKIAILNEGEIIGIADCGGLFLLDVNNSCNIDDFSFIDQLECMKSYTILEVSCCKNLCALGGFLGDIYIYHKGIDFKWQQLSSYQIPYKPRIFSIHWLSSNKLLTCVNDGFLLIWRLQRNQLILEDIKQLPPSKERFSTCACALKDDLFVVGDRKGNIYVYGMEIGPKQYLKRAHNFMGVTNLYYKHNRLISLGKDSKIKEYIINAKDNLEEIGSDKMPFSWITYYHSISDTRTILTGFKGDNIIIFDYSNRSVLFETKCGGGHRSWDIHCDHDAFHIAYIKDKLIHTMKIPLRDLLPRISESSFHGKEINALTSINYGNSFLLLSGGEDTTFRIHKLDSDNNLKQVFISKSHLSSIRTICFCMIASNVFYLFSGGGRGQIIFWKLFINARDILCVQMDSYHEFHEENEPENRIMDICAHSFRNIFYVFAVCSDGNIKVFNVQSCGEKMQLLSNIFYDTRCILKVTICMDSSIHYLITMATDGLVVLWNLSNIIHKDFEMTKLKPHQLFNAHSSGINSFCTFITSNRILFATGGDDNKISINLIAFHDRANFHKHIISDSLRHCAQITGVFMFNNILITTSIDQKIIAYEWDGHNIHLHTWVRYNSSVADIQGMRVLNFNENKSLPSLETHSSPLQYPLKIIVYGKGIEILTLNKYSRN